MVLAPALSGITAEAIPDATGMPFMVIVAVVSFATAVSVTEDTLLATVAV